MGTIQAYVNTAEEFGCACCGKHEHCFHILEFYLLPSRLVRKRQREKARTGIYCRDCYEQSATLPIRIGDRVVDVPKISMSSPYGAPCPSCGRPFTTYPCLHGLLISSLMIDGSFIENECFAVFCTDCVEAYEIGLPRRLG